MKASILPTSQGNSQYISIEHTDITQTFSKMGLWELRAVYPCARDRLSRIASEKFSRAWIYGFILPLSHNIIKDMGLRDLTILDRSEKNGSLGGLHD